MAVRWRKLSLLAGLCLVVVCVLVVVSNRRSSDEARTTPIKGHHEAEKNKEYIEDEEDPGISIDGDVAAAQEETPTSQLLKELYPIGPTWSEGFCKEFLVDTFDQSSSVCADNRMACRGTKHNSKMGMCTMSEVAILPRELFDAIREQKPETLLKSASMWLLRDNSAVNPCPNPSFEGIEGYMEPGDYARSVSKMVALVNPQRECVRRVTGTTYVYMGMEVHIYFKFLGWYNLHRTIMEYSHFNNYKILRVPEGKNTFLFSDFEKLIFPEATSLGDMEGEVVCFERIVLVPWAYAATPFRCKMDGSALKSKCLKCEGKGLNNDLHSFRSRVISGCGLEDRPFNQESDQKSIVVVERKQYHRRLDDKVRTFQRVWTNSDDLISTLRSEFPRAIVTGIHAEDLTICEQISLAHGSNILIGMHGAGLVHLWWQQQHGVTIELVPNSQRTNAAFVTLAKFLGRTHIGFKYVTELEHNAQVDIGRLVSEVKKLM